MASFNELIASKDLVLVDFTATWCGPCQVLAPILHDLKEDMGDQLSILKIDVDKNQQLASNYRVQGVPTLILFKEGTQVWRQSGVVPLDQLKQIVNQQLA